MRNNGTPRLQRSLAACLPCRTAALWGSSHSDHSLAHLTSGLSDCFTVLSALRKDGGLHLGFRRAFFSSLTGSWSYSVLLSLAKGWTGEDKKITLWAGWAQGSMGGGGWGQELVMVVLWDHDKL